MIASHAKAKEIFTSPMAQLCKLKFCILLLIQSVIKSLFKCYNRDLEMLSQNAPKWVDFYSSSSEKYWKDFQNGTRTGFLSPPDTCSGVYLLPAIG
jgi:hypothetical protein